MHDSLIILRFVETVIVTYICLMVFTQPPSLKLRRLTVPTVIAVLLINIWCLSLIVWGWSQ